MRGQDTANRRPTGRGVGVFAVLAILFVLAGCSAGSSNSKLTVGLAGSTADHPSQPPQIAAKGPDGSYAFVYDNQIWLHKQGQSASSQLTHLVLSNGATIRWGPLVWSQSGTFIAFALSENLTPTQPDRETGPLYYVDTSNGTTYSTSGTGSVYGHTYDWLGDGMIFYATGGGIMMYNPGEPSHDPRVWQILTPFTTQFTTSNTHYYTGANTTYGDLAVEGSDLFFTQVTLASLGATGQMGTATLEEIPLGTVDTSWDTSAIQGWLTAGFPAPAQVANLGVAYANARGDVATGAWAVNLDQNGNGLLVRQQILGVDTTAGAVTSSFCVLQNGNNLNPYSFYGCANSPILQAAGKQPTSAQSNLSVSPDGKRIAFSADALYLQNTDGSGAAKVANIGWATAPSWSADGAHVFATQLVKETIDASGVRRDQTNVQWTDAGASSQTLISGAQNLAWNDAG